MELACFHLPSASFQTDSITAPYLVNAALNALLALVTIVANILVLSALRKNTSLRLPSKLLIGNLVLTDLGVGIVAQPMFAAFLVARGKGFPGLCSIYAPLVTSAFVLACVSLLTITTISLDRYIALFFHLRYRDIVTTRRVFSVLVVIWVLAGFYGFFWLRNPMLRSYPVFTSISFTVTTLSYTMIYRRLRHPPQLVDPVRDEAQIQKQQAANPLNVARYRRSTSNMLWIYSFFVLCYLPYISTQIARRLVGDSVLFQCLLEFAITVVYCNSCLNPFVYCLRLPKIRAGVRETLHKICSQSPAQQWIPVSRDR